MNKFKSTLAYFFYCCCVQVFFNYHTMLSFGASWLLIKLVKNKPIPESIRYRMILFFNGQPYLVPYAIAAIASEIEQDHDEQKILKFIESAPGFLGAIGDDFYWNALKPFSLSFPIVIHIIFTNTLYTVTSSILALIFYNYWQIKDRITGINKGKELGFSIIQVIKGIKNRWGNLNFARFTFLFILICLIIIISNHLLLKSIFFALSAIIWGIVAGVRGNSRKYFALALLTFFTLEVVLW